MLHRRDGLDFVKDAIVLWYMDVDWAMTAERGNRNSFAPQAATLLKVETGTRLNPDNALITIIFLIRLKDV